MRVADWVAKELIKLGVQRIYCLPGGFVQTLDDGLGHSGLQMVWMLDERAAAFAACAEAQYTNQIGVCAVTAGPGSTNLLTGIASAWCDSLPILCICGEINTVDLNIKNKFNLREGSAQDVDMIRVARPITKYVECVMGANVMEFVFNQAIKYAMEGRRGPVIVQIPLNVQGEEMP